MDIPNSVFKSLFFTTIRISAKTEKNNMGTGFFVHKETEKGKELYICTCKHLINNANEGTIFFQTHENGIVRIGDPVRHYFMNFEQLWIKHPLFDVAILPVKSIQNYINFNEIYYTSFSFNCIPNSYYVRTELDAVEDTYIIGYPNDLYDKITVLPIFRRGITAYPYILNYNGEPKFLIDASIFKGSSGSPVIFYDRSLHATRIENKVKLLGITTDVLVDEKYQNIDIGVCIKAGVLREMIEDHLSSII